MNKLQKVLLPLTTLFILPSHGFAQDLNLFQATDNPEERQTDTRRSQRASERNTDPAFTLVGTSRFGDKYYASLMHRSGQSVQVPWTKGRVQNIDGYPGFGVADIRSRAVSVRFPDSDPCIQNLQKGVECNGNIGVLRLANATPMESRVEPEPATNDSGVSANEDEAVMTEDGVTLIRNPFSGELQEAPQLTPEEIAAREARRQRRAEAFRDFEIVRIADDEIPEGMQRVRTPFGDRLEPVED